jgi:peptide/nickel transport system substrate-binding protein
MMLQKKAGKKQTIREYYLKIVGAIAICITLFMLVSCSTTITNTTSATISSSTAPMTSATTSAPTTNMSSTPTTPASTDSPKYGGVMKIIATPVSTPSIGWPPSIANSMGGSGIVQDMLETLLRGDNKGNVHPWLAESFTIADDLKSITFHLRKGVKFHDGSDFNAQVAKWNLENMTKVRSGLYSYWSSVEIIDDYTIRVNLNKWIYTLPMSFAEGNPAAFMVSKAAFDKNGLDWMKANPVGTGPFKFDSYQQDVKLKVVKNPDYWIKGKPYLDGIEYNFISDQMTTKMSMQNGDADMVLNTSGGKPAADYLALGLKVNILMSDNQVLVPDTANADSPWAKQKVREAVEYAIDREALAETFGFGFWQAPYQIPARDNLAYDPDYSSSHKYDPEKAKQLLSEAGYPDGFSTTIIVSPFALGGYRDPIVVVQDYLSKVNVQAELVYPEIGKYLQYMGQGTWPQNSVLVSPFPGIDFINMLGQSWARSPALLQAYQNAVTSTTMDDKIIRTVTDIISQDTSMIPICESGTARAQQTYVVAGFNQRNNFAFYNSEDFWLNK